MNCKLKILTGRVAYAPSICAQGKTSLLPYANLNVCSLVKSVHIAHICDFRSSNPAFSRPMQWKINNFAI